MKNIKKALVYVRADSSRDSPPTPLTGQSPTPPSVGQQGTYSSLSFPHKIALGLNIFVILITLVILLLLAYYMRQQLRKRSMRGFELVRGRFGQHRDVRGRRGVYKVRESPRKVRIIHVGWQDDKGAGVGSAGERGRGRWREGDVERGGQDGDVFGK
ncbi:hypothetical protein B0O99DRAFT_680877 [Bisporella sp. PMI_857]|nr:hypothetical protein B0O99DRAFT_680877 [Bisporella sp. PMI_857]